MGYFSNFYEGSRGVGSTSEIIVTKFEQNRMYTARETGKLRKKSIKKGSLGFA